MPETLNPQILKPREAVPPVPLLLCQTSCLRGNGAQPILAFRLVHSGRKGLFNTKQRPKPVNFLKPLNPPARNPTLKLKPCLLRNMTVFILGLFIRHTSPFPEIVPLEKGTYEGYGVCRAQYQKVTASPLHQTVLKLPNPPNPDPSRTFPKRGLKRTNLNP